MDQLTSRNKTINDKYGALLPENILCCNPAPEVSPEDISIILNSLTAEKEIADIYALVHNKAWWIEDDLYDFNETSQQYLELRKSVNLWFALEDRVEEVVFTRQEWNQSYYSQFFELVLPLFHDSHNEIFTF